MPNMTNSVSHEETIFSLANAPNDNPDNSNINVLTQAPSRSSNFNYSALPHALDQPDNVSLVSRHTQLYHEFYQYPWFRSLIILIYGLTLGLAGNVLWFFPYLGTSSDPQERVVVLVQLYAPWLAYNLAIVWIFILVSLPLSDTPSERTQFPSARLGPHNMLLVRSRWNGTVACNSLTFVLLGSSVAIGFLRFYLWFASIRSSGNTS